MGRGARARAAVAVAAVVLAGGLGAAGAVETPSASNLQISTNPPLYPPFQAAVSDYVSRCHDGVPIGVSVQTPPTTAASVDGQPARTGSFSTSVRRRTGQEFSVVVTGSMARSLTYYVRCLPPDFPAWSSEGAAPTQAEWYLVGPVDPTLLGPKPPPRQYVALFDSHGVPVWWLRTGARAFYETVLPNGDIAVTHAIDRGKSGTEERRLDGSEARTFDTVGSESDFHDFELLSDGDVLMATNVIRHGVDLRVWGGPAAADVLDPVVQEVTPRGSVQWSWDTLRHVSPSEMDLGFRPQVLGQGSPYDVFHLNSLDWAGDSVVISFRHLSALFSVDRVTGTVNWKLGGSPRTESLRVAGDPNGLLGGPFGGQHDARVLSDGTVTVHDNGTNHGRPPRAVRYLIDPLTRTATLIEQVTDGRAGASLCCGSARKLSGGDWVIAWGFNNLVTETTPAGLTVFSLHLARGQFSYRAVPVLPGQLSRAALRAGMNAQYRNGP